MITPAFVARMARYNIWQNQSLYGAAEGIGEAARREDRGAFFGSIQQTLCHLLWGDTMWMSRFDGWEKPGGAISATGDWIAEWSDLVQRREQADAAILRWADAVTAEDLSGDLHWYSGAVGRDVSQPRAVCITHFFNHQTHHRGQVHAMLTAAGAKPDDTDLIFLPD